MKFSRFSLTQLGRAGLGASLVAMVLSTASAQQPAAAELPTAPQAVPAMRVAHATHASLLAAARAGSRLVAVGDHGVVLLSDDAGRTYRQAREVPVDVALTSVSFANERDGWAVGHWGVVLRTADGGETWAVQRLASNEDRPLFAVHFFDAQHGVAVGLWSLVLTTADGGKSWQTVEMPVPEGARRADLNLLGLFADARGRVYATGERGMLVRSDDQGRQWSYISTGYAGSFWTGTAAADGALLVGGLRGSLFRSADEGRSWTRIDTNSKSSITSLARVGNDVIGVGLDGLVLRSAEGGAVFRSEVRPDRVSLTAVIADAQGKPVMFSRQGVVAPAAAAQGQAKP